MKDVIDSISKRIDNLVKYINEEKGYDKTLYDIGYKTGLNHALKIVNDEAEQYNGGWIPVSERLPDNFADCLICDDKGRVYESAYRNGAWLVISITDEVIAWQPLPEPYLEVKD